MTPLIGFLPFLAFFLLMRLATPLAGLLAGAAMAALLLALARRRGESAKPLELGALVLFGGLALLTLVAAPAWTVATVRLVVDGGLALMIFAALAAGWPFTLPYARERVPPALWATPGFWQVNRRISAAWGLALLVCTLADAAVAFLDAAPPGLAVVATVAALAGAAWFTRWYPEVARRAAQPG
ncbi:MAG TPA: hypothetical protein VE684_18855 [Crenalkalicoccus sp.]|jgi:hypothetical protein|nr:hypothetical protein [Crenalkalicoccus sp.]